MSLLFDAPAASPLGATLGVVALWGALGLAGLVAPNRLRWVARVLFPIGAAGGLVVAVAGLVALTQPAETALWSLGLPGLPFHLRLDALSAFFLVLLGVTAVGVSLYSAGYLRPGERTAPGLYGLQYHLFLAAMALVLLADDAYLFMLAWETMAVASYFLVTSHHTDPDARRAGFLYLLIAHLGAIGILLSFGVLAGPHGDYSFAAMRANHVDAFWTGVAFLLALFGFGAKAGLLPLHAWLPEAHPAAPSPVSALMSGVMLKTAVYGMLRLAFDLLHGTPLWWGVVALLAGLATALFGVLFAAVQTDMKRLLAYSSIENVGIIVVGIGLTLIFRASSMQAAAALALAATLYHCLNHAVFKSLLFLVTGSVLHATKERSLGKLGGLVRKMPWVAGLGLVGTLAIAGLPPLNGFVSEWLLLQAFLASPSLPNSYLRMLVPLEAAAIVLAIALAGYVMVKFYGVIFLGRPREDKLAHARDAGAWERVGLSWLAGACVAFGLAPLAVLERLDAVTALLTGGVTGQTAASAGPLFVVAIAPARATYSPLVFLLGIAAALLLAFVLVRALYHGRVRRAPAWDCGYPSASARTQDTAEGFGQPIKQIFEPFFHIERQAPSPFDTRPRYRGKAEDKLWHGLYLPLARAIERASVLIGRLQHGRIRIYLLYSFVTLLLLLVLTR